MGFTKNSQIFGSKSKFELQAQLMEESPEETAKREDMLKLYTACKDSLKIIGRFSEFR
jgi:hypothetical protein